MAGLQRSAISFRRQGSSGLVWDDKLLTNSGELINPNPGDKSDAVSSSDQKGAELKRSKSDGGARRAYRTVKVQEAEDPPSPRVSGCGFCSVFGKSAAKTSEKRKSGKRKHLK